MLKVEYIAYHC